MKCVVCNKDIKGRYQINAWVQAACLNHDNARCYSCDRFILPNDVRLDDGRCQCSNCLSVTVCMPSHIEWAKSRVYQILKKSGINDLPAYVPLSIVSPHQMAEIIGNRQINIMQPGLAKHTVSGLPFLQTRTHHIYIFNMMSRLHFAGVLAHELLHVWINEKGYSLNHADEEGICNLGSYLLYTAANSKATKIHLKRMEENPDPVYGEGYRKVKRLFDENRGDIQKVVEILRKNKK